MITMRSGRSEQGAPSSPTYDDMPGGRIIAALFLVLPSTASLDTSVCTQLQFLRSLAWGMELSLG